MSAVPVLPTLYRPPVERIMLPSHSICQWTFSIRRVCPYRIEKQPASGPSTRDNPSLSCPKATAGNEPAITVDASPREAERRKTLLDVSFGSD